MLDTGSQSLSKGDDVAIADRASLVRNDEKELSPLPLGEGARRAGEGKKFAQQTVKPLVPQYLSALVPFKKIAFTLAEVLITLGIIGVVAAMTMPTLIQNHKNQVVETSLKKFYSVMNQAIVRAEVDYGDRKFWYQDCNNYNCTEAWFKKYFEPYLVTTGIEKNDFGTLLVKFPDGSALAQVHLNTSRDWVFFPRNYKRCIKNTSYDDYSISSIPDGGCAFYFEYIPITKVTSSPRSWKYLINKGFEPWKFSWDRQESSLYDGCAGTGSIAYSFNFCTALIQYNGWKIPKNYPKKIQY